MSQYCYGCGKHFSECFDECKGSDRIREVGCRKFLEECSPSPKEPKSNDN